VTVLSPPRHSLVECALSDAKRWCAGQVIDDRAARAHAARVAVTLGEPVAGTAPELIAAHDLPVLLASTADKIVALASLCPL
jgi:hypothetical protein